MYFTKIQGPRPARQGSRWVGEVIFNIFTFFHRVTRPYHPHIFNHPCQLIDVTLWDSTDNFIFPFSSPALVMNAFRFYVMAAKNITSVCEPAKERTENDVEVNLISQVPSWFKFEMNNIDFSDFFIMFSCRDSGCSTLLPQFIPFPHALLINSSHWILLFIHIRWWTCTT